MKTHFCITIIGSSSPERFEHLVNFLTPIGTDPRTYHQPGEHEFENKETSIKISSRELGERKEEL